MRNKKIIFTALLTLLGFTTDADAARKNRNSGARITANRSISQNVNVSGTTTTINATVADTTTLSNYSTTTPAPITDKVAERNCTTMVVNALQKHCKTNKCKNPTEIYATLIYEPIANKANEIYCANFLETAVNKLWNSYDSVATLNEENCNIALARSLAAEACYRELLAKRNDEKWDERNASLCNATNIIAMYKELTGEDATDDTYDKLNKNDLEDIFSKVGKMGWTNISARIGRFADLNLSSNSDEYPRELVQLVNSLKSTGNVMCGPDRYTELYDTNFALSENKSSLEKSIQDKGLLKGAVNWGLDQVGAVVGENRTDSLKQGGFIPKKKDSGTTSTTTTPAPAPAADPISEPNPEPAPAPAPDPSDE